jgi:hypothetical protein
MAPAGITVAVIMVVVIMVAVITVAGIMVVVIMVVSGSVLDGAGADGVPGGAHRTIRTMHHPLLLSSRLQYMSSRPLSERSRVTGITARIQKVTTHMSRTVQAGG